MPVGVATRKVQEIHACESNKEAAKERDDRYSISGVESSEEDEGGTECSRGEGDIIKRIHAVRYTLIQSDA